MEEQLLGTLKGKNILMFCVRTFSYENIIADKLRSFGANVMYFDERPSDSNFVRGLIRIKRSLYQHRIDAYYQSILNTIKDEKIDFLFVIRGEVVPIFFLEKFKLLNPYSIALFFTWDSFTNHSHATSILHLFDKKFTFDSHDALKYNLHFRPLFYNDSYKNILETSCKYQILFIGTAHSDRYSISDSVVKWGEQHNYKSFTYYYMHGRLVYWYKRIFEKGFEKVDFKKLSYKSISVETILDLYNQSQVILDIQHPNQTGLTMRTFETIGASRKLITTNSAVKEYSFYNENNILIIDRNNIKLNIEFFKSPYLSIDKEIYEAMSITGWLYTLFVKSTPDFWIKGLK